MNKNLKNCVVYKHTNKINGKCYIGIVLNGRKPEHRWGINGCNYLDNTQYKFARAILKYGWDNFEHEILFAGLTAEEAKAKEKELIKKYDSYKNGYNSTLGGDGSLGLKHSKETKEKLRRQHLGTKATEEVRKKMSLSQRRFREKLTFEERQKIFGLSGKKTVCMEVIELANKIPSSEENILKKQKIKFLEQTPVKYQINEKQLFNMIWK